MNLEWAVQALSRYGLPGVFAVVAMEYACLPLPSEVVLPLSGMLAAATGMPLPLIVATSVLAGLVGSTGCYCVGAWGGRPLVERLFRRMPRALSALDGVDAWQADFGGLSVMVARVIPVFRTWVSFAAGLSRQRFGSFVLYSTMGIIVWNTALILAGYYLYASGVALRLDGFLWVMPVVGMAVTTVFFLLRRKKKAAKQEGGG